MATRKKRSKKSDACHAYLLTGEKYIAYWDVEEMPRSIGPGLGETRADADFF
jgi:hypothetical protein